MKTALVLGVNGSIGHHLAHRILQTMDWCVYGMDVHSDRVERLLGSKRFRNLGIDDSHFAQGRNMTECYALNMARCAPESLKTTWGIGDTAQRLSIPTVTVV